MMSRKFRRSNSLKRPQSDLDLPLASSYAPHMQIEFPKYAWVMAHCFTIERVNVMDSLGSCYADKCVIKIRSDLPPSREVEVLWHELAHAYILSTNPRMEDEDRDSVEENFAEISGAMIASLMLSNPHIVEWSMASLGLSRTVYTT